jgi:uncharacterized protein
MSETTADADFFAELQKFVGLEIGPPVPGPDEINAPMIRHFTEAIGDTNPVYTDVAAAEASVHGGLVAPPAMLQAWVMNGLKGPARGGDSPYEQMNELLFSREFRSVVGTNSEQTYQRYLRPGDRVTMRTVIDSISEQKTTGLGTGHFVSTRQDYYDEAGELVGSMLFRIFRFKPKAKAPVEKPKPPRPRPSTTFDNTWWFDALNDGRLLIQRCAACGTLRYPAGPMCGSCNSHDIDVVEATGGGTIHSFTITHYPQIPSFDYPLAVVLVDLDEGVRMVMNTIDTPNESLTIGARVQLSVQRYDDELSLPVARLVVAEIDPTTPEGKVS